MANEYLVNSADLTALADAIRTKGGTSSLLEFPGGFADAIAAIQAGGGGGLAYDMGEFVLETDAGSRSIQHNLGAVPEFIIVWTNDFAENGNTSSVNVSVAMLYISNPWGLAQRLTSSNDAKFPFNFYGSLGSGSNRLAISSGTSFAYGIQNPPTETQFWLAIAGNVNAQWRAGVTYKYFVSEAPWL